MLAIYVYMSFLFSSSYMSSRKIVRKLFTYEINDVINTIQNTHDIIFICHYHRNCNQFIFTILLLNVSVGDNKIVLSQREKMLEACKNDNKRASGNGPTPEALLSFYLNRLTPAPFEPGAYEALLAYLRGGGAWTGTDAQLRVKASGLLHLVVASSEYQLV